MSDAESQLPDLRYVRELAKVFKQYGLDEIEIETGEQRILLRRGDSPTVGATVAAVPVAAAPAPAPAAAPAPVAATEAATAAAAEPAGDFITSPFVGTFYSAPRPDAEQFVTPGAKVQPGQMRFDGPSGWR